MIENSADTAATLAAEAATAQRDRRADQDRAARASREFTAAMAIPSLGLRAVAAAHIRY